MFGVCRGLTKQPERCWRWQGSSAATTELASRTPDLLPRQPCHRSKPQRSLASPLEVFQALRPALAGLWRSARLVHTALWVRSKWFQWGPVPPLPCWAQLALGAYTSLGLTPAQYNLTLHHQRGCRVRLRSGWAGLRLCGGCDAAHWPQYGSVSLQLGDPQPKHGYAAACGDAQFARRERTQPQQAETALQSVLRKMLQCSSFQRCQVIESDRLHVWCMQGPHKAARALLALARKLCSDHRTCITHARLTSQAALSPQQAAEEPGEPARGIPGPQARLGRPVALSTSGAYSTLGS